MTENPKTDPSEINEYILNAAINKQPVFDSFKKLSNIYPNQTIDYVDFEWKYFQFYHGSRGERSPLKFSDFPIDVLEKVVEKLTLADCLILRKVSPDLRNLVDSTEIQCERIVCEFRALSSTIEMDYVPIKYDQTDDECCQVTYKRKTKRIEDTRNFQQVMIADASTFLKHPKLKIDYISFTVHDIGAFTEFFKFLKSLNFQLDARAIHFHTPEAKNVIPVLQLFKLNRLETIGFDAHRLTVDELNKIAETEQWKRAKELCWSPFRSRFQMEKMFHFESIEISKATVSEDSLFWVRDLLLSSTHLKVCLLDFEVSQYINNVFGDEWEYEDENVAEGVDSILSEDPAYDAETRRYSLPNSREYFQLHFYEGEDGFAIGVCFKKKVG